MLRTYEPIQKFSPVAYQNLAA